MPTLLAVIPHPDDEAYSFAGTIAAAAHAGWRCRVECASFGERGKRHDGGPSDPESLARTRAEELAGACDQLGAEPPRIWGLVDGHVGDDPGGADRIAGLLDEIDPQVILSLGADGAYGHPDHITLHHWVIDAWQAAGRNAILLLAAFPRGLFFPQWALCRAMMGDPPRPAAEDLGALPAHYRVSLGDRSAVKRSALAAHRSQLPSGTPEALFPPGIVARLLGEELFRDGRGRPDDGVRQLLTNWHGPGNVELFSAG